MPTVTGSFGDKPTMTFPAEGAPSGLTVEVLHEGTGTMVQRGQALTAHYLGQVWGGAVFDNSYDRGAPSTFPIGVGRVIRGWDTALVGKNCGSRVLISIPPEYGYGPGGHPGAGIKGTDTLVFVVDLVSVA